MLDKKYALITGASRGIGAATARIFAKKGANLILVARNKEALQKIQDELSLLTQVHIYACDLQKSTEIKKLFGFIRTHTKELDILIHAAGMMYSAMQMMSREQIIKELFDTNFISAYELSRYASKMMLRQKSGSIVFISSIMALEGAKAHSAYSASKSALKGLMHSLAKEYAPHIRINCVAPGVVQTDMIASLSKEEKERIIAATPLARLAMPEEVAQTLLFLSSDMSSFITSQTIRVDGGLCSF